jgi:acetyltransferase-like isoleucine patch superfamily enzyme
MVTFGSYPRSGAMALYSSASGGRLRKGGRIAWTVVSALAVESAIFGLAVVPAVLLWEWPLGWRIAPHGARVVLLAMWLIPAYLLFALCLMAWSALAMRLLHWRTPPHAEMRIADLEWSLLHWGRYLASAHVVRLLAGTLFRATPLWTCYHRLNGARLGRRVYINSLTVMDDNLLEFGDDVVIGDGVHLSGHTVEGGIVRTAPVRLGSGVTIGVGSVIGIGVEVGEGAQVGALSVVAKHHTLAPHAVYGGVPVRRLDAGRGGGSGCG